MARRLARSPICLDFDHHFFNIRVNNTKRILHVFVQVKVIRRDESLFGHMQQPDAVQYKHSDFIVHMAPADQVKRSVEEAHLVRVNLSGGLPQDLCQANLNVSATWQEDGQIVFSSWRRRGIYRIPEEGGEPEEGG